MVKNRDCQFRQVTLMEVLTVSHVNLNYFSPKANWSNILDSSVNWHLMNMNSMFAIEWNTGSWSTYIHMYYWTKTFVFQHHDNQIAYPTTQIVKNDDKVFLGLVLTSGCWSQPRCPSKHLREVAWYTIAYTVFPHIQPTWKVLPLTICFSRAFIVSSNSPNLSFVAWT